MLCACVVNLPVEFHSYVWSEYHVEKDYEDYLSESGP